MTRQALFHKNRPHDPVFKIARKYKVARDSQEPWHGRHELMLPDCVTYDYNGGQSQTQDIEHWKSIFRVGTIVHRLIWKSTSESILSRIAFN